MPWWVLLLAVSARQLESPKTFDSNIHRVGLHRVFLTMAPVTMPVLVVGLTTCIILEIVKSLPERSTRARQY